MQEEKKQTTQSGLRWQLRLTADRMCAVHAHNSFGDRSFAAAGTHLCNFLKPVLWSQNLSYKEFNWPAENSFILLDRSARRLLGALDVTKSSVQTRRWNLQLLAWSNTTVPHRPLCTIVRRISTAASSNRYSAFFGGFAMPAQHLGPRALSVTGPLLWNSVLDSFRDPDLGTHTFRRLLKTHLVTHYWSI